MAIGLPGASRSIYDNGDDFMKKPRDIDLLEEKRQQIMERDLNEVRDILSNESRFHNPTMGPHIPTSCPYCVCCELNKFLYLTYEDINRAGIRSFSQITLTHLPYAWRYREELRFARRDYRTCPPLEITNKDGRVLESWSYPPEHFVHTSVDKPDMIAFTPSIEKGQLDQQTRIKIGKYLQKYSGLDLTPVQVAKLANLYRNGNAKTSLRFAETRAEIARVYRNGPSSCMKKNYSKLPGHPAEVYASGDVAIAYIKRNNRITARAVVSLKNSKFFTVYGDEVLIDLLRDAGFTRSSDALDECRLLKIPYKGNQYLMPYLDTIGTVKHFDADHFIATRNGQGQSYGCGGTNGLILAEPYYACDLCGDLFAEEELRQEQTTGDRLCEDCRDNCCQYCNHGEYRYTSSDHFYEYQCEYYTADRLNDFDLVILEDQESVTNRKHAVIDHLTGKYIRGDDAVLYVSRKGKQYYTHARNVTNAVIVRDCIDGCNRLKSECYEIKDLGFTVTTNINKDREQTT